MMNKAQKKAIIRIAVAIFVFVLGFISKHINFPYSDYVSAALFVLALVIAGYDVIFKAVRNIFHGQVFDENFLMVVATIGAVCIKEFPEGAGVMIFYQIGELFQNYAVGKSRQSISDLMDIRPDYANREINGKIEQCDPYEIETGDEIVILPGERVPLDCVVLSGSGSVDASSLTGESIPVDVAAGSTLLSGSVNISGALKAKVTKEFDESTAGKILELVESATENKAKSENFITKFARWYTPAVVVSAVLLAVLPPLLIEGASFSEWLHRGLTFLVISCPCALVISVPLSFFGGIGAASKIGVLVKGSNFIEELSKADTFVFDKTGTLTKGSFDVKEVNPSSCSEIELVKCAAMAEYYSEHPIAKSVKSFAKNMLEFSSSEISDYEEIPGMGVRCKVKSNEILAGNARLLENCQITAPNVSLPGTVLYVAKNQTYLGYILISDSVKDDSKEALTKLSEAGVNNFVMLTGDNEQTASHVASTLGINDYKSSLMPQNKVEYVQTLLENKRKVAFVGDGINDAPVLALSSVGVAMGGVGSDAAIEAADVVVMTDELSKLPIAVKIARKTMSIVKQNIVFSLLVKFVVLVLGAFGIANMWLAVFADVGVAVIAILNAMRCMNVGRQ